MSSIYLNSNFELVFAEHTTNNVIGDKSEPTCDTNIIRSDIWLLKTDTAFNIIWDKSLGGIQGEVSPAILQKKINQIVLIATSNSDSSCEKSENNRSFPQIGTDYWICAIDSNGNKIWDKTFGGTIQETATNLIQFPSGNYVASGISNSPVGGDKSVPNYNTYGDYWLVKFDSLGYKIWDHVYGGPGDESLFGSLYPGFYGISLLAGDHESVILTGTTESDAGFDISDSCRGFFDIWIIKIDSTGNKIWDKRYGGSKEDGIGCIIHTKDKGYILCGFTSSPADGDVSDTCIGWSDIWIIKLDSMGNKQWDKRYGGTNAENASWIEPAPGGGYWISGATASPAGYDVSENKYGIASDYWIFKIDSMGNKLWDKRFGGPGQNWGSLFVIMPDSSIFLAGNAEPGYSPVKTDSGKGSHDFWVVHFKYSDISTAWNEAPDVNWPVSVFPNPASTEFQVNLALHQNEKGKFSLFNSLGQTVEVRNIHAREGVVKIKTDILSPGVYLWKAEKQGCPPQYGKEVLIH